MLKPSRREFLGWSAVGLAGLLVPSRTVVGPSIDIRQARQYLWPTIDEIQATDMGCPAPGVLATQLARIIVDSPDGETLMLADLGVPNYGRISGYLWAAPWMLSHGSRVRVDFKKFRFAPTTDLHVAIYGKTPLGDRYALHCRENSRPNIYAEDPNHVEGMRHWIRVDPIFGQLGNA